MPSPAVFVPMLHWVLGTGFLPVDAPKAKGFETCWGRPMRSKRLGLPGMACMVSTWRSKVERQLSIENKK